MAPDRNAPIDTTARARLIDAYSPGARIVRARRLRGGLGAHTHVLHLVDRTGQRSKVVLRVYLSRDKLTPERAIQEFRTLQLLDAVGVAASRPLLLDSNGAYFGEPAMLLSYLPGRSIYRPAGARDWTGDLARAMLRIHAVTPARFDLSWLPRHGHDELASDLVKLHMQVDASGEPLAAEALSFLEARVDDIEWLDPCLVHEDFWSGNTIWKRGRLTGVIDWVDATLGDPRFDPPQCAIDAYLANDLETADAVRNAYIQLSPQRVPDLWFFEAWVGMLALLNFRFWLMGYHDAGLTDVTTEVARERVEYYLRRAMSQGA